MKGDFSRRTFDQRKHYTSVLKQQGRVDLDSDWNEYAEILQHQIQTQTKDVIGLCGAPERDDGFRIGGIGKGESDFTISPGRIYVDGISCELEEERTYHNQPDYPNPPPLKPSTETSYLVYLDVWRRHITAVEDSAIHEVALGGPDTTTRLKTLWQVRAHEVRRPVDCRRKISGWPPAPSGARLTVAARADGYAGPENRLYRVEIHDGGSPEEATFKWSRYNGSVLFAVQDFVLGETRQVRVRSLGPDLPLRITVGDWVEVLDDETELGERPGTLGRIAAIDEEERIITLDRDISVYDRGKHPKVRLWDQGSEAMRVRTDAPLHLEHGIEIRFTGGNFKTGDFWMFTARAKTGEVETLTEAPPLGVRHHYCRLAILKYDKQILQPQISDCRRIFPAMAQRTRHSGEGTMGSGISLSGAAVFGALLMTSLYLGIQDMRLGEYLVGAAWIVALGVMSVSSGMLWLWFQLRQLRASTPERNAANSKLLPRPEANAPRDLESKSTSFSHIITNPR